jgi:hypothetical protein
MRMKQVQYEIEPYEEIDCEIIDEVIKDTIEEAKANHPEKAKELDKIKVKHSENHIVRLDAGLPTIHIVIIFVIAPIVLETWREIVLPMLKRKFKIKEHKI